MPRCLYTFILYEVEYKASLFHSGNKLSLIYPLLVHPTAIETRARYINFIHRSRLLNLLKPRNTLSHRFEALRNNAREKKEKEKRKQMQRLRDIMSPSSMRISRKKPTNYDRMKTWGHVAFRSARFSLHFSSHTRAK